MSSHRVIAPLRRASALADAAFRTQTRCARLLPVAVAFSRFAADLEKLSLTAESCAATTFSPSWWRAIPPPRGYAQRLLLLREHGELRAAVWLRERTLWGLPTGILQGSNAKGVSLVLSAPGTEAEWIAEGLRSLFRSHRCLALLLNWAAGPDKRGTGTYDAGALGRMLEKTGLEQRTQPATLFWQTALCPTFDQTLAALGHRTRRNLRHALRRVARNSWQFFPELTPAQVSEATAALSTRSTHPYTRQAIAARLELERTQGSGFSMGLRNQQGEWLSLVSGVRRPGSLTDIFWQSNVAHAHDSVALSMRALLMRHEGERGSSALRWIGGTSPLMEHCCQPEPGVEALITRPGLRLTLLQRLLETRLASSANPMQKLLRLEPSGAFGIDIPVREGRSYSAF